MIRRLRPYGAVTPLRGHVRAWLLGIRDGWNQPRFVSTSANVDHLYRDDVEGDPQESLDRGINLGQWLRSPLNHEQQEEGR